MTSENDIKTYAKKLEEAWEDGHLSPEEYESLTKIRKKKGISSDEHARIEKEILYRNQVEKAWEDGEINTDEMEILYAMRSAFNITDVRADEIEQKVLEKRLEE